MKCFMATTRNVRSFPLFRSAAASQPPCRNPGPRLNGAKGASTPGENGTSGATAVPVAQTLPPASTIAIALVADPSIHCPSTILPVAGSTLISYAPLMAVILFGRQAAGSQEKTDGSPGGGFGAGVKSCVALVAVPPA